MKRKILIFFCLLVTMMLPVLACKAQDDLFAFSYQDRINTSNSVFFMDAMEAGDTLDVFLSTSGQGEFGLFLFQERPTETFVNFDRSIDPQIYEKAVQYEIGSLNAIEFTADNTQIYYIQIILIEDGPAFYLIQSNRDLTRYYLPMIPGYPVHAIIVACLFSTGLILLGMRKRRMSIK